MPVRLQRVRQLLYLAEIVGVELGSSGLFVSFVMTWPSEMRSAIFGGMSIETVAR
jgi:hypothetical protein